MQDQYCFNNKGKALAIAFFSTNITSAFPEPALFCGGVCTQSITYCGGHHQKQAYKFTKQHFDVTKHEAYYN